jgi:drug/metabolite transporter (DMT)-like permease
MVGVLFLVEYQVADPSTDVTESQSEWGIVLLFSASLLSLAVALLVFAGLIGGPGSARAASAAAGGAVLASIGNVVEDGLSVESAFFAFVAGTAVLILGLVALTAIASFGQGARRLLAVVPAATLAAVIFYVIAGGYLMLGAWLTAAALALVIPRAGTEPVSS